MKVKLLNQSSIAAMLLMAAAAALVAIALVTSLGEFVTAAFVISGMVCAITGIFLLTFSGGEPVDPHFIGVLPAQGCLNLCRISSDLGINGNACFLPPRITGEYPGHAVQSGHDLYRRHGIGSGILSGAGQKGLVTVPSCDPLIQDLRKRNRLVMPDTEGTVNPATGKQPGRSLNWLPGLCPLEREQDSHYAVPVPVH